MEMNLETIGAALGIIATLIAGLYYLVKLVVDQRFSNFEKDIHSHKGAINQVKIDADENLKKLNKAIEDTKKSMDEKQQNSLNQINTDKENVLAEIKVQAQQELNNINDQRKTAQYNIQDAKQDAITQLQNTISSAEEKFNTITKPIEDKIALLQSEILRLNSIMKTNLKAILRYTDNGDGTVTDNKAGLIWLKNANCFDRLNWEEAMEKVANLSSGQCGLSDDSSAGDWRLPTIEEWKAMVYKRYEFPTISNAAGTDKWKKGDAFSGVRANDYWSSSSYVRYTANAWYVDLYSGSVGSNNKTSTNYVWPVRGGQ